MRAIGIILAGGNSKRMKQLSEKRAVCAMPIAGSYRSIDFALSNMEQSQIQKVAVLTQYNSGSLNEHLSSSKWWDFGRKQGGLFLFPPTITAQNSWWYRGTADAIYQNLSWLRQSHEPYVVIASGAGAEIKPGNALQLKNIPLGLQIHNIEMTPGRGGKIVRSAGQYAILRSREGDYCQVKLPSGEVRMFHINCLATIGQVGNLDHMNVSLGKAGKARYKGFRPHVRGVVQNPIDHPMGGGEGRSSGGGHPVSPWGQLAKGKRTRHPKKPSNKFIVERRRK